MSTFLISSSPTGILIPMTQEFSAEPGEIATQAARRLGSPPLAGARRKALNYGDPDARFFYFRRQRRVLAKIARAKTDRLNGQARVH